jgi:hypothetical protein
MALWFQMLVFIRLALSHPPSSGGMSMQIMVRVGKLNWHMFDVHVRY